MEQCEDSNARPGAEKLLQRAQDLCLQRGQRFTPHRRNVYEIIVRAHCPIGAYAILDRLLAAGQEASPPTVYRALEFLAHQNLIHRVESLNAFLPCNTPNVHHSCQLLICTGCGSTAEVDAKGALASVTQHARAIGFSISEAMVELKGLCARCRDALRTLTRTASKRAT